MAAIDTHYPSCMLSECSVMTVLLPKQTWCNEALTLRDASRPDMMPVVLLTLEVLDWGRQKSPHIVVVQYSDSWEGKYRFISQWEVASFDYNTKVETVSHITMKCKPWGWADWRML